MTAPSNPEGYPLAETWEDCARHVEAGGVVEVEDGDGVWWVDTNGGVPAKAKHYRSWDGHPDNGNYYPRRLVPIPTPTPSAPHMVPSMVPAPEGAVLARWEDVKVGDTYASVIDGHKITRSIEGPWSVSVENPLVWCWPAPPKPVTVEVDVELLDRARRLTLTDADLVALNSLVDDARDYLS